METWVKAQLDVLLPVLAVCSASDEERIVQVCSETVEALHNRGLGSDPCSVCSSVGRISQQR